MAETTYSDCKQSLGSFAFGIGKHGSGLGEALGLRTKIAGVFCAADRTTPNGNALGDPPRACSLETVVNLIKRSAFLVLITLVVGCALSAGPLFVSGDGSPAPGLSGEFNFSSFGGFTQAQNVAITPHPAWEPNHDVAGGTGAVWVSFRDTGFGGVPQAVNDDQTPTAYFWETFDLSALTNIAINVWADDTARVVINGKTLIMPNFTQGTCAIGAVGCEPGDVFHYVISSADLKLGRNDFVVSAYQTGGDTFGVMYEASAVPEPGTCVLLGIGLLGLGAARWRNRSAK